MTSRRKPVIPTAEGLSAQQMTVLLLLWEGLGIKQVATEMGLSSRTVKNYHAHICEKWGVSGRVAMMRKAMELGLLQVPEAARGWRRTDMEVPG